MTSTRRKNSDQEYCTNDIKHFFHPNNLFYDQFDCICRAIPHTPARSNNHSDYHTSKDK